MSSDLETTFQRTVDEGQERLTRTWPGLIATGTVGGIDICLGVFGLYLVYGATHSRLLAGLGFSIGFVALALASSELFTENFLVPVAAVVAHDSSVVQLIRLWLATLVMNLVAAWLVVGLIMEGFPQLRGPAIIIAHHPASQTFGLSSMANAIMAGAAITLMTWMERSTESVPAKLVAAVVVAFLLVGGQMNHAIVGSVELFAALHVGASFGYLDWLRYLGISVLGNILGGLALVTVLRLVQVGGTVIHAEQARDPSEERINDSSDPA